MGQEFRYWCPMETRRLLWLVGMMFVLIMVFQLLALPAGNILSFISSGHTDQMAENGILLKNDALLRSQADSNITLFDGLNATNADRTPDRADKYGKERGSDVMYAFESEASRVSNQRSGIDNNDEDSSLHQVVQPNTQSNLNNSDEIPASDETEQRFSRENMSLPLKSIRTSNVNDGIVSEGSMGNISSETGNLHDGSDVDDDDDDDDGDDESSLELLVQPTVDSAVDTASNSGNRSEQEESEQSFSEENSSFLSKTTEISNSGIASVAPALTPVNSLPNIILPRSFESSIRSPVAHIDSKTSSEDKDTLSNSDSDRKSGKLQKDTANLNGNSPTTTGFKEKRKPTLPISGVLSVSEMHSLLLQSWSSPSLPKPRWDSAVDKELLHAKSQIENAPIVKNDPILYSPVYWNVSMFKRSYELMENMLKVYIYKEGERPILHQPVLKGIYASEGWFMKHLEASKKFVTKKPRQAHLFYLPFSSRNLEIQLYVPNSHSHRNLVAYLRNYLNVIVAKYPFWNRTEGADHFLAACHDWAPGETQKLMSNCIRALCNADAKGAGFVFGKDASLPETYVRTPQNPLRELGGKPPSQRTTLAFFAGSMHGYLRPILLKHWANKDPDMKIFGKMPKARRKTNNYVQHMKNSKYCICARGYEVNSPRVVEAIMYECVPVIISDNYVPPFIEILNWESFAVFILEKDIPNLKNILVSIPEKRYLQMQMRIKKVQQHFLWHAKPVKYDLFHMILHSIWYNRVFQMQPR